jgi:uncharacterized linocin/CFP29 family protein
MADEIHSGGTTAGGAGVDVIGISGDGGFTANGTVAQRLLQSGGNFNSLRTNAVLLRDEWRSFDNTVVDITRENLVGVAEVMDRGLIYDLPNALGSLTLEWQELLDDLVDAEVSMSGLNEATKDRLNYGTRAMPIPLIHKEFFYNLRFLEAARRNGRQVETDHAAVATRKVAEKIEALLFSGLVIAGSVGAIYGLLNHPNRNTGTSTGAWATMTGDQIVADIIRMIAIQVAIPFAGPWVLFIPLAAAAHFGDDYKPASDKTIMERVLAIPGIDRIIATPKLTGNTALLVQMSSDVVQMIDGLQPTMVEWETKGGFEFNFKIIAIMLPRVRASGNLKSGIVHFS